jgi:hypothetical protein
MNKFYLKRRLSADFSGIHTFSPVTLDAPTHPNNMSPRLEDTPIAHSGRYDNRYQDQQFALARSSLGYRSSEDEPTPHVAKRPRRRSSWD